jgi:hypothetical protein
MENFQNLSPVGRRFGGTRSSKTHMTVEENNMYKPIHGKVIRKDHHYTTGHYRKDIFKHPRSVACRPQTPMVRWDPFTKQTAGERNIDTGMMNDPLTIRSGLIRGSIAGISGNHSRRGARAAESA